MLFNGLVAGIGIKKQNLFGLLLILKLIPALEKGDKAFEKNFSCNTKTFSDNFNRPQIKERIFFYKLKIAVDYLKVITKTGVYIYNRDLDLIAKL